MQHITAAELRAEGRGWPHVAEATGYSVNTVSDYPQIDGFRDLVEHFREQRRSDHIREHWLHGTVEALDAQRQTIEDLREERRRLVRLVQEEGGGDAWGKLLALSKELAKIVDKYLDEIGFKRSEGERRKLQAQEAETGKPGDRVNVDGASAPNIYIPDNGRVEADDD